ncbi:MAG: FliG C-terminal domain-containing protein [Endomicrobiia bacterium]
MYKTCLNKHKEDLKALKNVFFIREILYNNFKKCKNLSMKLIVLVIFLSLPLTAQQNVQDQGAISPTVLLEYETKMEQQRSEYVQKNILDKIFGPNRSTVIIDITLGVQTQSTRAQATEKKVDAKRKLGEVEYILPGVPKPGSIAESSIPQEAKSEGSGTEQVTVNTEVIVRKTNVTVIYDEKIKDEKVNIVRESIVASLGLNMKRDILEFKKAKFTSDIWQRFFETLILPKHLIPLILALLTMLFLFGPLSEFLRNYIRMLRERGAQEISIDTKMEGQGTGQGQGAGGTGAGTGMGLTEAELAEKEEEEKQKEEEEEKYIPFSYVTEENLKRLIYLIAKEKPEDIAIVLSYLKAEFVKEIIESFTPQLQAEVALALAQAREIPQEEVVRMDNYVKERIDFLVGGIHQLLDIIQKVDKNTRDNILEYLKNEKPEIYNKVRPMIFLFEDIVEIPDLTLQTIIRELKPENIARALRNTPQNLVDKFFKNMSEGAQALVREEMDYGRPMTKEQIEEEQNKILELIKKLESEGKIYVKERARTFIVDAKEVGTINAQEERIIENSPGYEYYVQGINFYESGDLNNAVEYFNYSLQLDPNLYESYQYLGNIYYNSGDYNTALEYFKKVVQLNPKDKEFVQWVNEFEKSVSVPTEG